jgi:PAS domain S-box-containing protein
MAPQLASKAVVQEGIAATVSSVKKIADDTFEVKFALPLESWTFAAGQYVTVTLPELKQHDPRGNSRDFSLTSLPGKSEIAIAFRGSSSGFKKTLIESLKKQVHIRGPYGVMTLPATIDRPLICIAGGIGVTPFVSMARYVTREKTAHQLHIISFNSSRPRIAFARQFRQLKMANPNLEVTHVVGAVSAVALSTYVANAKNGLFYIAGPPKMTIVTLRILETLGVPPDAIVLEEFSGYYDTAEELEQVIPIPRRTTTGNSAEGEMTERPRTDIDALLQALSTTALVSETNAQGTITYANDKFVEISKYPREELIGKNHRILKSGFHPKAFYDNMWATITRGRLWRGQFKNKAKDGSYYWVDTSIAPILDASGRPEKYISVRFPITERQYAEEKLQQQAKLQDALTTLSREALANPSIASLFDITIQLFTSKLNVEYCAILKVIPEDGTLAYEAGSGFKRNIDEIRVSALSSESIAGYALQSDDPVVVEDLSNESRFAGSSLLHDHGAVSGVAVLLQGQDAPYGVLEVFTNKKRLFSQDDIAFIQAVANLLANAIRNQELDTRKDEFLSMASHELRTPLTSLKTFVYLLQHHLGENQDERTVEFLAKINTQIDRQIHLINNLLDLSRLTSGKLTFSDTRYNISDVVEEVVDEVRATTPTNYTVQLKNNVSQEVSADVERIRQVVANLLNNAVKYSPEGGQITVSVRRQENTVVVSVADKGIGISPVEQKRIFDRFSQAQTAVDLSRGGLGLGLHIAKQIIDHYNGKIWVDSRLGKGSTFSFSLPLPAKNSNE